MGAAQQPLTFKVRQVIGIKKPDKVGRFLDDIVQQSPEFLAFIAQCDALGVAIVAIDAGIGINNHVGMGIDP